MNVFDIVARASQNEKVLCVLIGGVALHFHGVARQTMDVDFLVSPEDFETLERELAKGGYRLTDRSDLSAHFAPTEKPKFSVDLLFVDRETLEKIKAGGTSVPIGDNKFIIPSVQHLVALKLHALKQNPSRQSRDLPDIASLVRRHPAEFPGDTLADLCRTYGAPEIAEEVHRLCRNPW
jgi:hypothetical protein